MKRTAMYLVMLVMGSALAAGCGQKGPLERPQQPASVESPVGEDTENR